MERVTVLKNWNHPTVKVLVTAVGMEISMPLNDFVAAIGDALSKQLPRELAQAVGSPATLMTTAGLERALTEAVAKIQLTEAALSKAANLVHDMKLSSVSAA